MTKAKPQSQLDLFTGLSKTALAACINHLNSEILTGNTQIWKVANFAYKTYSKACSLEQYALGVRIKKLNRLEFQALVNPMAQSIWAYGDKNHAHLF